MLSRLTVQNFRSLQNFELDFEPLTALVGANGVGKSSVLDALNLALGLRWPSMASFRVPEDFSFFDETLDLQIRVRFDEPIAHIDKLNKTHSVHGFGLSLRPYKRATGKHEPGDLHDDFVPLDDKGEVPVVATQFAKASGGQKGGPVFQQLRVSRAMREEEQLVFIDHRRDIRSHAPWARGSILARLLAPVRKDFKTAAGSNGRPARDEFAEKYALAMEALRTPKVTELERMISDTANRTLGFMGSAAVSELDVRFGFADPSNPFGSLELLCDDGGMAIPATQLGSGMQSAIVVGLFEAFRASSGNVGTVLIEEPEMHLHPQAQRYFFKLIREIVEDGRGQVIYSTHSPAFIDIGGYRAIRLMTRENRVAKAKWVCDSDDQEFLDEQNTAKKLIAFSGDRSDLFFARRVLLVEGPSDRLAVERLATAVGTDLDQEGVAIIECGSKSAIPFMARICSAFEMDFAVLHDADETTDGGEDSASSDRQLNELISETVGDGDRLFVFPKDLDCALGISGKRDKPRRVAERVEHFSDNAEEWPAPLRCAVDYLRGSASKATG